MVKTGCLSKLIIACLLSSFITVSPIYAQKKPDFDSMVTKFIQKIDADSLYIGDNYNHQELERTEILKNGVIESIEEKLFQVEKRNNLLFKKLIEKDDLPVIGSEFQQKKEIVSVGTKLLARFEFGFEREEMTEGEKCFVFSFKPKRNLPEKTREDKVINQLGGEIWMVRDTLRFHKLTAHLLSEANYTLAGIGSGKLQKADFVVSALLLDGHFASSYVQVEYEFSAKLFHFVTIISEHAVKKIYYKNYERRER